MVWILDALEGLHTGAGAVPSSAAVAPSAAVAASDPLVRPQSLLMTSGTLGDAASHVVADAGPVSATDGVSAAPMTGVPTPQAPIGPNGTSVTGAQTVSVVSAPVVGSGPFGTPVPRFPAVGLDGSGTAASRTTTVPGAALSFADIMSMVEKGVTPPGVKSIPDQLSGDASALQANSCSGQRLGPKKPWECAPEVALLAPTTPSLDTPAPASSHEGTADP